MGDVLRNELVIRAARSRIFTNGVIPVYVRDAAAIGGPKLWIEQRYWLGAARIHDTVTWRKQEEARKIIPRILAVFELEVAAGDFLINRDQSQHLPFLMSIRGLGCWLTERWHMSRVRGEVPSGSAAFWPQSLTDYFSAAVDSLVRLESCPSVTIHGITLHIDPGGSVDLSSLAAVWPGGLASDWQLLVDALGGDALRPLRESLVATWFDFYRFACLRLYYSSTAPGATSLLRSLVHAMVNVTAFLVECHLYEEVLAHDETFRDRDIAVSELHGASKRYRSHGNVVKRLSLLERIDQMGSDAAISRAITGVSSLAASAMSARNHLYWCRSMEVFKDVQRVSVGWDGSNHGGREVVCGYGADVLGRFAVALRPKASPCHSRNCGVAMVKGLVRGGHYS